MERKEVEKVVKEAIFEKMGEFNGLDHAAQIMNEESWIRIWLWIPLIL